MRRKALFNVFLEGSLFSTKEPNLIRNARENDRLIRTHLQYKDQKGKHFA